MAVQFDPQKQLVATASMDTTARLFNCETGNHSCEYNYYQDHYTFGLLPEVFMTSIIKTLLKINFVNLKITLDNVVVKSSTWLCDYIHGLIGWFFIY